MRLGRPSTVNRLAEKTTATAGVARRHSLDLFHLTTAEVCDTDKRWGSTAFPRRHANMPAGPGSNVQFALHTNNVLGTLSSVSSRLVRSNHSRSAPSRAMQPQTSPSRLHGARRQKRL